MQSSNRGGIAVRCLGEHYETMSVFSSQNVTGSNAQTNLDTLYTGWTRLPHMLVPSCDLQQAHTVTCPRVDMQRGHRRHLPDLSTRVFTSAASGLYSHNKVPPPAVTEVLLSTLACTQAVEECQVGQSRANLRELGVNLVSHSV